MGYEKKQTNQWMANSIQNQDGNACNMYYVSEVHNVRHLEVFLRIILGDKINTTSDIIQLGPNEACHSI